MGYRRLHLEDGFVEYLVDGPEGAPDLLIFHVGSLSAAVIYPGLVRAAAPAGMRVACYSRGGYGGSPRRRGRSVADEAATTVALADRLGHDRFFTAGWSGGGPVALAAAALAGDRVRACVTLASLAPPVEAGRAWEAWFSPEERHEWEILMGGETAAVIADYQGAIGRFGRITASRLSEVAGPPDARAVAHGHATEIVPALVRGFRRGVSRGPFGWLDDQLAEARDWGFRVADIRVPVVIRHGDVDRLVDVGHGRWLAEAIPGARGVFLADAGHGSIALPWSEVIEDLVDAAR